MPVSRTTEQWQIAVGGAIRDARLARQLPQETLASQADISTKSLRNLEAGHGSTLATLIKAVRALDREDWLDGLDEGIGEPTPMELLRSASGRPAKPRRAPRRKSI